MRLRVYFLLMIACSPTLAYAAEPDAFDFAIEMFRRQGANPTLITSGAAEITLERFKPINQAEIDQKVDSAVNAVRGQLAKVTDPAERQKLENFLKTYPSDLRKAIPEQLGTDKLLYRLAFDDNRMSGRYYSEMLRFDAQTNRYVPWEVCLRERASKNGANLICYQPPARLALVKNSLQEILLFQLFGRMQGKACALFTAVLLLGGDPDHFVFSEDNLKGAKQRIAQTAALNKPLPWRIVGTKSFEGSTVYLLESGLRGQPGVRIWVDAARGYITPLIEEYEAGTKLARQYKSSGYFLHEQSGLYFPENHEESAFNTTSGELIQRDTFHINPKTLHLNEPISGSEFAVRVPRGVVVIDERDKNRPQLMVRESEANLAFREGELDLQKVQGLGPVPPVGKPITPVPDSQSRLRPIAAWVCAALLVAILAVLIWRRRRKRLAAVLLAIAIGSVTVTGQATAGIEAIVCLPSAVEFGERHAAR